AIGASRARLVRQLLTESVLLGLLSGLAGLLIGYGALRLFWILRSPNFNVPKLDPFVLGLTFIVAVATGFVFGMIPALRASSINLGESLKEEARTVGKSRTRVDTANVLIVAQVAFSFLLLMTAGLFLRSIARAYEIDPGFQTAHLALFMTN